MGMGYLEVEVFTASRAMPISGASVVIKDNRGGILMQLVTDRSGITETVQLKASDIQHTLDPNDPGPHYTVYDVEVTAEGFKPYIIHGVHIFDTVTSFLPINMLPLIKEESGEVEETYLPEQGVELNTPRNPQIPIPAPVVMTDVFIPDYITVHLGSPN